MPKKYDNKYWENETPETIKFGNYFMRCYDKAGKLQLGIWYKNKTTGNEIFQVKFVIDRDALFDSDEAPGYLRQLIEDWEEIYEAQQNAD